jgi:hypothetical protein
MSKPKGCPNQKTSQTERLAESRVPLVNASWVSRPDFRPFIITLKADRAPTKGLI